MCERHRSNAKVVKIWLDDVWGLNVMIVLIGVIVYEVDIYIFGRCIELGKGLRPMRAGLTWWNDIYGCLGRYIVFCWVMWQSFELAWFIAEAGMRRACKWSNAEAWCRGDNVERMNMVADQARTNVGNLTAWRRETAWCRGDNATWKFSRDNMRNAGTDLGGVVSLLAPPGFILVSCWLLSIYWMLKLDAYAMLCDDCWWLISELLELLSLSICRNAHPSFFPFHFRFGSYWWVFVKNILGS